uniref:hypothetical protein n=1 Tax=uncultured Sphingomonas sp. TaxID=158754 RepID=UPI0035CB444E
MDHALRLLSVPAWLICIGCLAPAIWRLIRGRGRNLDPIWGVVFLLAVNRMSFLLRVSAEMSHATAALLALAMAWTAHWYQRHDA